MYLLLKGNMHSFDLQVTKLGATATYYDATHPYNQWLFTYKPFHPNGPVPSEAFEKAIAENVEIARLRE